MSFSVALQCRPISRAVGISLGSHEASEDYEHLVMEACDLLANIDCNFRLTGFGSSEWALDVSYDLAAFMEQLPELLSGVRGLRYVEVDIYSQGVERMLEFHPQGEQVRIRCRSRTDWVPDPDVEFVTRDDLDMMLTKLAIDFARALAAIESSISQVSPFVDWKTGKV